MLDKCCYNCYKYFMYEDSDNIGFCTNYQSPKYNTNLKSEDSCCYFRYAALICNEGKK